MERNKEVANLNGLMELCTMDNGATIKCTEPDNSNGLTVDNTKAHTCMTKNMDKEFTLGRTVEVIKEDSSTENNMEKAFTNKQMAQKHMASGKKERRAYFVRTALNGLSLKITYDFITDKKTFKEKLEKIIIFKIA